MMDFTLTTLPMNPHSHNPSQMAVGLALTGDTISPGDITLGRPVCQEVTALEHPSPDQSNVTFWQKSQPADKKTDILRSSL